MVAHGSVTVVAFDLRRWTKNETIPELGRTHEGNVPTSRVPTILGGWSWCNKMTTVKELVGCFETIVSVVIFICFCTFCFGTLES